MQPLSSLTGGSLVGYSYDNSGNIVTKRDLGSGVTTNYVYDDVNRLIQEKPGSSIYYYDYDKYNNMTYSMAATDKEYSYDANNRLTGMYEYGDVKDGISYNHQYVCSYDNNGNMLTKDCRTTSASTSMVISYGDYTYNVWGELISSYIEVPLSTESYNTHYTYYADGLRKSKTTSGTTYNYYYHGDTVLNETKTTSGTTSNYATNIIGVTGIEARKQNGTTGFFGKDLHGDVRYAFNLAGETIADYTYDAWGNAATSSTPTWAQNNPVRYNGQYLDTETGMYYLRARYYDPQMNRFISEDPIKDGINWYAYAGNNPVNFIDPSGLNYYEVIEEIDNIYTQKQIMETNDPSSVEYADAYQSAMQSKTDIANNAVYVENWSGLKVILYTIVNGNNNSVEDILEVRNSIIDAKNDSERQDAVADGAFIATGTIVVTAAIKSGSVLLLSNKMKYPGNDPTKPPGKGWEWRGKGEPGSKKGGWYKPKTGESLRPDLDHPLPIGPHWDYQPYRNGPKYRWYPNGRMELK